MQCEICGNDIKGNPVRVSVEGTNLEVCKQCAHYGKPSDKWSPVSRKVSPIEKVVVTRKPRKDIFDRLDEINPEYAHIIRKAREERGLSIEDLASKIMEKVSLLKKIERGELIPEDSVRKKLENVLNVQLTEKFSVEMQHSSGFVKGTTLGDVAIIKKKTK